MSDVDTPQSEFAVELPLFSGPFRLLASLILDQKIDVCDVPVARVTDAFVNDGLEALARWTLEETTWFVAMCASLLELKVGRLLPRPAPDTEEDLVDGISPDLLYARSLELAAFRRVAEALERMIADAALMAPRTAGPPPELAHLYPDVMEKVTPDALHHMAAALFAPRSDLDLSHVTPIRASLADALTEMRVRLQRHGEVRFSELVEDRSERIDIVIRFLALLELHREGRVHVSQAERFGDIRIRWEADQPTAENGRGT
ncbi:MAG TPA: ScpA family protein [Actinomycetota bacterium]|jgi:segregation and condensation protein A